MYELCRESIALLKDGYAKYEKDTFIIGSDG